MPDTGLVLNPGSGGDSLDTWQDPTNSRKAQKMVLSDYRGGITYVASSGMITPGAAAVGTRIWGVFNPSGSSVTVFIHRIFATSIAVAAATSPVLLLQRAADVAGIATGTAVTLARIDTTAVGSPVPVIRNMPTSGTVAGGFIGSHMLPTTAGAMVSNAMYDDNQMMYRDLQLAAGNSLLIVTAGVAADTDHRVQIDCILEVV